MVEMNFPLRWDARGGSACPDTPAQIAQSIRLILLTYPGERPLRPDFGSRARSFLFEPMTRTRCELLRQEVFAALVKWEPRIELLAVEVTTERRAAGQINVAVAYRIAETGETVRLAVPIVEGADR